MANNRTNVLLVEDNPADVRLLRAVVEEYVSDLAFDRAASLADALQRLSDKDYDVILLDLFLPDSTGTSTIQCVREAVPELPIVVLTGTDDEVIGVQALQAGADEYLPKCDLSYGSLTRSIRHAMERLRMARSLHEKEAQLRQSQKMEAVGQLASGVAHEFNNLMQAILGYAAFAMDEVGFKHASYQDLAKLHRVAQRGAKLTSQLLIFSRQADTTISNVDLTVLVKDLTNLLRSAVGANVDLQINASGSVQVSGDASLLQQVLMNLCLNARDAMLSGGTLRIEVEADAPRCRAVLRVSDTGTGIPEEIRTRIFEPFFTTKEVGAGTGLGLATVYAIVEQHLGQIEIESQLGEGTTFSVYLPLAASGSCTGTVEPAALPRGGSELVLVAEDDAFVRDWVERVLTNAGYAVITATTGPEAIALFRARASEIDMVLLDYCLPGATGAEVHRSIQVLAPAVPCLVCTAYDSRAPQTTYMRDNRLTILHKPYEKNALLFAIRAALDVPCASEALAGFSGVNA